MYLHLRLATFDRRPDSLVVASGRLVGMPGMQVHVAQRNEHARFVARAHRQACGLER